MKILLIDNYDSFTYNLFHYISKFKKNVEVVRNDKINSKTIFVIEASSYQLEYSKIFTSNISAILNISPDHLERHKTIDNYVNAKFRLMQNQKKKDYAVLNENNQHIKKKIKTQKFLPKIIKIKKQVKPIILKKINNPYMLTDGNKENLAFVIEISKILRIKKRNLFNVLKKFNGLEYRQQIIFRSKDLTIINDSKATSFSSSESILNSLSNISWIVGGLAKKGDKFLLSKNDCKGSKAYIFGKNKNFFINKLKNKIQFESFVNLSSLVKKILIDIKNNKSQEHQTILFSPASASFDSFKNFEERGKYFNKLIKKTFNVK